MVSSAQLALPVLWDFPFVERMRTLQQSAVCANTLLNPGYGAEMLLALSIDSRNDFIPAFLGGLIFGYLDLRCDPNHYCSYGAYNTPLEGCWAASCFGVSLLLFKGPPSVNVVSAGILGMHIAVVAKSIIFIVFVTKTCTQRFPKQRCLLRRGHLSPWACGNPVTNT
jgi:hypothetical protein